MAASNLWTLEHLEILKRNYGKISHEQIGILCGGKSALAVKAKLARLGKRKLRPGEIAYSKAQREAYAHQVVEDLNVR